MSPLDRIGDIPESAPILLIVGGRDDRARPDEVHELHRRAASHSRLRVFEGAGHSTIRSADPGRNDAEILDFIRQATRREPVTGAGPDPD